MSRPRVLHLAFEEIGRPGSGGGAVRTHEINRRLAAEFDIDTVVSTWPGAEDRTVDGVRYRHVGVPVGGRKAHLLSYFAAVPRTVRASPAALVVEDFAAPIGSQFAGVFTRRPVVGVVQWLGAAAKAQQYRLPFDRVETAGLRRQRRLIAVSEDLAAELRRRAPLASVTVIGNGVDPAAFTASAVRGRDIVFLGRLEVEQKGLDLLLDAVARIAPRLPGKVLLAGDGPDRERLEGLIQRSGLAGTVRLVGRLGGDAKFAALAAAAVVAMPSRYETFGIVALESLAAATPVVAFDIACLRALVDDAVGARVPAFDVEAFAAALLRFVEQPAAADHAGALGRVRARPYDWDRLAEAQAAVYRAALADCPSGRA